MTAMHAVEIADSHHRAAQRAAVDALRAAARHVELSGRDRAAHRASK